MANKVTCDFVKTDAENLPKIDMFMVLEFIKNNDNCTTSEIRNAKVMFSKENFGDPAIKCLFLKKNGLTFTVKCQICSEHQTKHKEYDITLILNRADEKIISVQCHSCEKTTGCCKHAIAFLMWMQRQNRQPLITEEECFWQKTAPKGVKTTKKFIEAKEFQRNKNCSAGTSVFRRNSQRSFLQDFLRTAQEKQIDSHFTRYHYEIEDRKVMQLSIHQILIEFKKNGKHLPDDFCSFASTVLPEEFCSLAECLTRHQNNESLWHELRYGRIMDSNILEIAQCKTNDEFITSQIIEAAKVFNTKEMKPGNAMRQQVLGAVEEKMNIQCRSSGLLLLPLFPMLCAAPDAFGDDFVIEIKCRSREIPIEYYIANGKIKGKCKAQIQLQMLAAKVSKGYICVAEPNFQQTGNVVVIREEFDEKFINSVIAGAASFWKNRIFPKLFDTL